VPHRFFIPSDWLQPPIVRLQGDTAHQIRNVLRMQPGDEVIVLDNSGSEWQVRLTGIGKNTVVGQIVTRRMVVNEPKLHLTLYQAALKRERFEWVLQKGTELGVSRFVPTVCQRSVVRNRAALATKHTRWLRIIKEAAEQSGRGILPRLERAMSLVEAIARAQGHDLIVMPWEEASGATLKEFLAKAEAKSVAVFIGPEGGFTQEEALLAHRFGAGLVKLGPRILRAETAGITVCAAILYEMGEWD